MQIETLRITLAAALLTAALAGCGGSQPPPPEPPTPAQHAAALNLDSLARDLNHQDSVESNAFFYEQSYASYIQRYPGVNKRAFYRIAKGKDQDFCIFRPNPAQTCLDNGDKFNDLGLKQPAKDAYHAGLLSETYNELTQNVRLWGSMGQIALEEKDYEKGRLYFMKILAVEPRNRWARKQLASIP